MLVHREPGPSSEQITTTEDCGINSLEERDRVSRAFEALIAIRCNNERESVDDLGTDDQQAHEVTERSSRVNVADRERRL